MTKSIQEKLQEVSEQSGESRDKQRQDKETPKKVAKLQEEIKEKDKRLKGMEKQLEEKDQELKGYQKEVEKLVDQQEKEHAAKLDKLRKENEKKRKRISKLQKKLKDAQNKLEKVYHDKDWEEVAHTLADDNEKLETKIDELKDELAEKESQMWKLREKDSTSNEKLAKLQDENENLREKKKELTNQINRLQEAKERDSGIQSHALEDLKKLGKDLGISENQLEGAGLRESVQTITEHVPKVCSKLEKAKVENEKIKEKVENLLNGFRTPAKRTRLPVPGHRRDFENKKQAIRRSLKDLASLVEK